MSIAYWQINKIRKIDEHFWVFQSTPNCTDSGCFPTFPQMHAGIGLTEMNRYKRWMDGWKDV